MFLKSRTLSTDMLQLEEAGLETEEDEDMESKGIDLRLANVENLPLLFNFWSNFVDGLL